MNNERKVAALWTGKGAEEKGKVWKFPGSGTRYRIEENGAATNMDRNRLGKKEKRAQKRARVAELKSRQ